MRYSFFVILLAIISIGVPAYTQTVPEFSQAQYDDVMHRALSLSSQRNYGEARKLIEGSVPKAAAPASQKWQGTMLSFLGTIYQHQGRYAEAEDALNKSLQVLTTAEGPEGVDLIGPTASLGGLYYEARQFSRAEKMMSRAFEIQTQRDAGDPQLAAMLLTDLGTIYYSQSKDDEARRAAEQALEKFAVIQKANPELIQGEARNDALLGALDMAKKDFDHAGSLLKRARDIWESSAPADDPRRAESVANLGIYYSSMGNLKEAESLFRDADAVFKVNPGNNAYMQHFLHEYADVEGGLGNRKAAKQIAKRLTKLQKESAVVAMSRNVVDVSVLRSFR